MRVFTISMVISLLFVSLANCKNATNVPKCINGLCLDGGVQALPSEEQVLQLLGGSKKSAPAIPHRNSSCYAIATPKHKKIYIKMFYINVGAKWNLISINTSLNKTCEPVDEVSVDFDILTESKIGIGSTKGDILDAYGEPTYNLSPPSANLIKHYFPYSPVEEIDSIIQYVDKENELLTTRFFLSKNVVVGIDISADE